MGVSDYQHGAEEKVRAKYFKLIIIIDSVLLFHDEAVHCSTERTELYELNHVIFIHPACQHTVWKVL